MMEFSADDLDASQNMLLDRAMSDSVEDYVGLFGSFHKSLFKFFLKIVRNKEAAEDLTSVLFWRSFYGLRGAKNPFGRAVKPTDPDCAERRTSDAVALPAPVEPIGDEADDDGVAELPCDPLQEGDSYSEEEAKGFKGGSFKAWLFKIAERLAINDKERREHSFRRELEEACETARNKNQKRGIWDILRQVWRRNSQRPTWGWGDWEGSVSDFSIAVKQCLVMLPDLERHAVLLHFVAGLTYLEMTAQFPELFGSEHRAQYRAKMGIFKLRRLLGKCIVTTRRQDDV